MVTTCKCKHFICSAFNSTLTVTLVVANTPSESNIAGEQFNLTCSASVDGTAVVPSFQWLGPDGMNMITTDSLVITGTTSGVMSGSFTHASILQFDPLQSSHEGSYTCQITVGTATEIESSQVNVEGKS